MSSHRRAADIASHLGKAKRAGQGWKACCPAHNDENPSLALYDRPDGVAYKCMAGCTSGDVRSALLRLGLLPGAASRLRNTDQGSEGDRKPGDGCRIVWPVPESVTFPDFEKLLGWVPTAVHMYLNQKAKPLLLVVRRDHKDGRKDVRPLTLWKQPDGTAAWMTRGPPEPRPLYGLDRLAARPNAPVLLVEGEKTADAAQQRFPEFVAVTWQGGAKAVDKADWAPLVGRNVTAWPDNDEAGRVAITRVAEILAAGGKG